jgi:hypothetical protein
MNALAAMNSTMIKMAAILVIVVSVLLFEKEPNTYPIINTIQATNNILVKMIPKNIMIDFNVNKMVYLYLPSKAATSFLPQCGAVSASALLLFNS